MRRENRNQKNYKNMNIYYWIGGAIALFAIVFTISYIIYANKLNKSAEALDMEQFSALTNSVQDASSSIGKTVEESKNEVNNTNTEKIAVNTSNIEKTEKNKTTNNTKNKNVVKETNSETKEEIKEISFARW